MRTRPAVALLLVLLGACKATSAPPPPVPAVVTIVDTAAWSGNAVALLSPGFAGADSLPLVTVGIDTLSVRRSGDTVLAKLPDTNGVVTLTVRLHNGADTTADVRVYGFVKGVAIQPAPYGWWGVPWPAGGPTAEIGILNGRLQSVVWATGATAQLSADTSLTGGNFGGAVPSLTDPGLVSVTHSSGSAWVAVPFHGASASSDSGPDGGWAVQLRRGLWVVNTGGIYGSGGSLLTKTWTGTGFTSGPEYSGCGKPKSVALSPRHDRVVFTSCQWGDSEAVFDSSGAVAYRIPFPTGAVAFTPGSDTLFLASFDSLPFSKPTLFAIEAATGRVVGHAAAPGAGYNYTGGVALDPAHPWLYVLGFEGITGEDVIMVYDRATMHRLATLRAPSAHPYAPDLYVDPAGRRLYVVAKNNGDVTVFDLMP